MKDCVLIISGSDDAHADDVEARFRNRGVRYRRFDVGAFPGKAHLVFEAGGQREPRTLLTDHEGAVDLGEVASIWYRRPSRVGSQEDRKIDDYLRSETIDSVYGALSGVDCLHVPAARPVFLRWENKVEQLRLAHSLGFDLPHTMITNSPGDFLRFYREQPRAISKLGAGAAFMAVRPKFARYTERVIRRDLAYVESIRACPVLFQGYVDKAVEVRATVVGGQVFAAEIQSQVTRHTSTDWRRYDLGNTPHVAHTLPEAERHRCLRLTQAMGLVYGAIDLILTPAGRYIFLEVNPSGQYSWLEELAKLPISDAICELLTSPIATKGAFGHGAEGLRRVS